MEFDLWLGTEASYQVVQQYLEKFTSAEFVKEMYRGQPATTELDQEYGVDVNRPGLTLLRKVGEQTVIQVAGSLTPNFAYWHPWARGEVVSYEAIRDALAICAESGITDVLMHFDSGGGSVRGLSQTSDAMKAFQRGGGKIRAHSDSLVASAAYWLMSGANGVTASEMAEVGSIGTMAVVRTYVNTEETLGVKFTVIKAGKYKSLGNPFEAMTPEIKKRLQENIDETNSFFLKRVSVERNLMISETDSWAEGQVFFAEKARQVGLIDKVATLADLLGSGAAANTQSDNRRFDMEISAEKLAKIAAGADPKVVLTAAELEIYMASLETHKADEGKEADKPVVEAKEADKPVEEGKPAATPSMSEELGRAMRDLGAAEAKLEARDAELAKLQEANAQLTKNMEDLLVVAQDAVGKLQVALGVPREAKSTPVEVLQQYTALHSQMAKVFKTGPQASTVKTEDTTRTAEDGANFRLKHAAPTQAR